MPFEDWPSNQNQTSSTTPTTAPTAAVSATSIPAGGNTNTTVLLQAKNCAMFPATAIVAGFFPGLVIGALLVYLMSLCWARRKQNRNSTFRRMPDMEVTSTQNVHPNHKRFKSNTTSKSSKTMQDMVMIGFDPNDATSKHTDRKINLSDSDYPNSTTGDVDGAEPAEVERRGRLRVHGETPQLPSVHTFLPIDHTPLTQLNSPTAATRHARKTSNPSYDDITSKRLQFHQHPSEDCLRESALEERTHGDRVHSTSTESVGSSHHSSVQGRRYPIAVPDHMNKTHQPPPTLHIQTSLPQVKPNITTTNSNTTIIDDSEVDITPSTTQSPYPPHHHNQYPPPEAPMPPSAGYRAGRLTSTTDRSESMYPSSFLDLHFSTTPQLSNSTPHMNYSHQAYPPLPQIPPLFSSPQEQLYPNQFLQQPKHISPTADMISPIAIARIGPPPPHTLSTSNSSYHGSSPPPPSSAPVPSNSNNFITPSHPIPTRADSNGSCEMIVGIELDNHSINNNNNTVGARGMVSSNVVGALGRAGSIGGGNGHVRDGSMSSNTTAGGRYQHLGAPLRSGTMNGGRYSKQSFQTNRI